MLQLDTIQITSDGDGQYSVATDYIKIIDVHIDDCNQDDISLVKYRSYNDQEQRDRACSILTSHDIIAKE